MSIKSLLTIIPIIATLAFCACATATKTPEIAGAKTSGVTGESALVSTSLSDKSSIAVAYRGETLRRDLLGKWEGQMVGMNSFSMGGRTVLLIINEVDHVKGKVRGIYVRRYFSATGAIGLRPSEGQNEFEANLTINKDGFPEMRWRGDTVSPNADFEFILKGNKLIGTRFRGDEYHSVTMERRQ